LSGFKYQKLSTINVLALILAPQLGHSITACLPDLAIVFEHQIWIHDLVVTHPINTHLRVPTQWASKANNHT